jgi:hypothetical protein
MDASVSPKGTYSFNVTCPLLGEDAWALIAPTDPLG